MHHRTHLTLTRAARLGAGALLAVSALGATTAATLAAPGGAGSIWTTTDDCSSAAPQDANFYANGDTVFLRGKNFDADATYGWTIAGLPSGASQDAGATVASGTVTTDASGTFCWPAYVVAADDWGEYKATLTDGRASKIDNYRVAVVETTTTDSTSTESTTTTADTTTESTSTTADSTTTESTTSSAETTPESSTTTESSTTESTTTESSTTTADTTTADTTTADTTTADTTTESTTTESSTTVGDPGTNPGGTTDPGTNPGGTTDPGTTNPGATDPGATDPGATDPGATDQPTQAVEGITSSHVPTTTIELPPTDTIGGSSSTSTPAFLIAGLAAVAGLAILLAPTRRRTADRQA